MKPPIFRDRIDSRESTVLPSVCLFALSLSVHSAVMALCEWPGDCGTERGFKGHGHG